MATDTGTSPSVSPAKMEARAARKRITRLFNELASVTSEEIANTPETQKKIHTAFRNFLKDSKYHFALKNFDALLLEKSGEHALRKDGTVNWYHELVPILTILKLAKMGKDHGGFNLEDLDKYGGLDVAIAAHLRHDSVEDHIGKEKEKLLGRKLTHPEKMDLFAKQLFMMRDEIIAEQTGITLKNYKPQTIDAAAISKASKGRIKRLMAKLDLQIEQVLDNTELMTQQKIEVDGKFVKEDVKEYTARMCEHPKATPILFLFKQADVIHNFATMLGAFTPERRLKRVNEREDMYGHRQHFVTEAKARWAEFKPAIRTLDHTMAFLLFPNLRYLETMDEQYFKDKGTPYKTPNRHPVGIADYAKQAFSMNAATKVGEPAGLPQGLNSPHIFLKRLMTPLYPDDPAYCQKLETFLNEIIRPALKGFEDKAPYFFKRESNDNTNGAASPTPKSAIA